MKILWAITVFGRAGAEQGIVNLAPALLQRGVELELAAISPPYDLLPDLERTGVRVHRLDVPRHDLPRTIAALASLLRRRKPDVLHAHLFWAAFSGALARPALPSVRGIATHHNVDYDLFPARSAKERTVKRLYGSLMRGFAGQTGVSRAVARHFERHLRLRRVAVIPNALDTRALRPDPELSREVIRRRHGLPLDRFIIVMPARLVPEKGHRFALQALAELRHRSPAPLLLLLGDGSERAALLGQIEAHQLENYVALRAPLPHAELFPLLQACDAYLSASTQEGFGIAMAEAMALKLPVVSTDIPGVADVASSQNALLAPSRDAQAMAARLGELMGNADLRGELGRRGRESVMTRFDAEAVAQRWANFYAGLR